MLHRPPFDQEQGGEKLADTERRCSKRLRDCSKKQSEKASEDASLGLIEIRVEVPEE